MKYIQPNRLKVLICVFFAAGVVGLFMGLLVAPTYVSLLTVDLCQQLIEATGMPADQECRVMGQTVDVCEPLIERECGAEPETKPDREYSKCRAEQSQECARPVPKSIPILVTLLGVINIGLGAFFTWIHIVQKPREPDKRKKRRGGS